MRKLRVAAIGLCLALVPVAALAQTQTQTQTPASADPRGAKPVQTTQDLPRGFPYNTGTGGNADMPSMAIVTLRDFLSSRQDQQRAELIERIESLGAWLQRIQDERDRQYAQRFAAQQDATDKALAAAKELGSQALASAKEAVTKAESASDKRFEAGNEIKAAMAEQATTFMRISTADARFAAIEEKLNSVYDRLNAMQGEGQGTATTWAWLVGIAGIVGVLIGIGSLAINFNNRARLPEHGDRP